MPITRKYRRKKLRKGRKLKKSKKRNARKRRYRKSMRGGGCACASPLVGGRRRTRRKRHRRRRKRSRKSRRRSRKMKGGGLNGSCVNWNCDMPSNIGQKFTGYKYNNNPFLPDPKSLNSNLKAQKGGGIPELMQDFGLGDLLLNYYKGTNAALDTKHRWQGAKLEVGADPMNQPDLIKDLPLPYSTPNVPQYFDKSADAAAKMSIKA